MQLLPFFASLVGKQVVFMLPQDDAIKGVLVDYDSDIGMFLIEGDDGTLAAVSQSLILMVSEYIEPAANTEVHSDDTSHAPHAFDGHGYGPDQPNGSFGG